MVDGVADPSFEKEKVQPFRASIRLISGRAAKNQITTINLLMASISN
jgi:hypothetical protein